MPDFQYTARELTGQQVTGILTAATEKEAISSLASKNLFPLKIEISAASKQSSKQLGRRVPASVLAVFYSQLADLLKSGVPLMRSLELLSQQSTNKALQVVVADIRDQTADGERLFDSMRRHPKVFNDLVTSMIRAGEEGGFLEDVLKRVADFTEHQEELKGRVTGAMIYPICLLVVGGIIVSLIMVFFVPQFEPIFDGMRQTGALPIATVILLWMSEICQKYAVFVILAAIAAYYGLKKWLETPKGRDSLDYVKLNTFMLGPITRSLSVARFCRVLGTLLGNGVPVLNALRIAKDATGNRVLSIAIDKAADNVSSGKSLAKPLSNSGQFPREIVEMISVGEESNNLENVLIGISDNLEKQTSRKVDVAVKLLEPALLLGMAMIVLFVVVALMLPIMKSAGQF